MCGRFALFHPPSDWAQSFLPKLEPESFLFEWPPRYNIAPTQDVACVYQDGESGLRLVEPYRWGLLPFWAKEFSIGARMINARSETVHEKPSFRNAFKRRRCLIPASGYFEWAKTADGKQPHFLHPADRPVLAMAGLWEENSKVTQDGSSIRTCTVITTTANSVTGRVHDRMPVVLDADDFDVWLDPDHDDVDSLRSPLRPAADDAITSHPVDRAVGNVRNQGPKLVQPVEPND